METATGTSAPARIVWVNPSSVLSHWSRLSTTGFTSWPMRASTDRHSARTALRVAVPTTATSTSAGGGPSCPIYRSAHEPKIHASSSPYTAASHYPSRQGTHPFLAHNPSTAPAHVSLR